MSAAEMTLAHRIEAVLSVDGKLLLDHLPFRAGQRVEVIVVPVIHATAPPVTLRSTVLRYDEPTAPVAEAEWGALQCQRELEATREKLRLLEERYEANKREQGEDEHVRALSMRSLKRLINQLEEEIARFESRRSLRTNG